MTTDGIGVAHGTKGTYWRCTTPIWREKKGQEGLQEVKLNLGLEGWTMWTELVDKVDKVRREPQAEQAAHAVQRGRARVMPRFLVSAKCE